MSKLLGRKGYLFSIDAVVSLVLFIALFAFVISLWTLYAIRLNENMATEELQLVAFQVIDVLTKSPGVPSNWEQNPTQTTMLGLRRNPGSLDPAKVAAFLAWDYDDARQKFNVERFEYQLRILDGNGNVFNQSGMAPNESAAQSITVARFMLLEHQPMQILFTLWRK